MRLINGFVLLEVPKPNFTTAGGFDFGEIKLTDVRNWRNALEYYGHDGEPINPDSEYAPTRGLVIATHEKSSLQVGDSVFFHKNMTLLANPKNENAQPNKCYFDGKMLIEERELIIGVRGEEIIPLNGYVLLEKAEAEMAKRVFYVERDEDCIAKMANTDGELIAGQYVVPSRNWNIPLEREIQTHLPKNIYYLPKEYIHAWAYDQ